MLETVHARGRSYRDGYYTYPVLPESTFRWVKGEGRRTVYGPLRRPFDTPGEMFDAMLGHAQENPEVAEEDRSVLVNRVRRAGGRFS